MLDAVAAQIQRLGLILAVEKSEAVFFKIQYTKRVPIIQLEGKVIQITKTMLYLSMVVDKDFLFKDHIKKAVEKAYRVLTSLSRLVPNIGDPTKARRKLLLSVANLVMLYGTPVWSGTLEYIKFNREELLKVQRRVALRSICAYHAVSYDAMNILASMPTVDLLA